MTAIVAVDGLIHAGTAAAIPVAVVLVVAWMSGTEWCGLVVTSDGIESRMARRENRFRYAWTNVDGFEVVDNGAQVAIVLQLRDGSRKLLPSTRAWSWNRRKVKQIYTALAQQQAAVRTK
ncbi:MAG: hypothetical protein ACLP01_32225 [Solirubrobacteraceae bacterium]